MKYERICENCAKDVHYPPGVIYEIINDEFEVCQRCKEKWAVRLAMTTWYMTVLGSAISLLFAITWSYDFGRVVGLQPNACNLIWILLLVSVFWFVTTSLGKWLAMKFGIIGSDTDTAEWDWNHKGPKEDG